jgi:hypothetical protein
MPGFEVDFLPVGEGERSGDGITVRYGEPGAFKWSRTCAATTTILDGLITSSSLTRTMITVLGCGLS